MISVVMPAYNAERFIAPAIESILDQTYTEFEFIIVDDQSTDQSRQIIDEYAKKDGRIRVLEGPHIGPGAAMNVGLWAATREWIAVMHADDVALPERLARQLEWAENFPEVIIWGSGGYRINSEGERLSHFMIGPADRAACHALRRNCEIVQAIHSTVMMKRAVALQVNGYDCRVAVSNSGAEDIELFDRMLRFGDLVTIPDELMLYRMHGGSLSMNKYHAMREMAEFIRKRQYCRLNGSRELDLDEFRRAYRRRSLLTRLNYGRVTVAGLHYRQAGIAYGERKYAAFFFKLGLAFLASPTYAAMRLWEQVLSPASRQKLAN